MRAMSKILLVFLLISYGPPLADAMDIKKRFNQSEIDDAYGQIDGLWTGTYNFVHSTTKLPETNIKSLDVKMIIKGKKLLFNIRKLERRIIPSNTLEKRFYGSLAGLEEHAWEHWSITL